MDPRSLLQAEFTVEGDLLVVRAHGTMELEAAQRMVEEIKQIHGQHGRYFFLIDLTDALDLSPALRRMLAENEVAYPPVAAAYFGGDLNAYALNALLQGVVVAFGGRRRRAGYFANEPEARAWLAEERARPT